MITKYDARRFCSEWNSAKIGEQVRLFSGSDQFATMTKTDAQIISTESADRILREMFSAAVENLNAQ